MSEDVAVSVIVRTVDRAQLLAEALESVVRQTERRLEAVVVDMGPVAGSVVERFRDRLPHVRHVRFDRVLSRAEALNEGIRHAAAPRIAILDDDNVFDPPHLGILVAGLERTGADLVYTGVRRTTYTRRVSCSSRSTASTPSTWSVYWRATSSIPVERRFASGSGRRSAATTPAFRSERTTISC